MKSYISILFILFMSCVRSDSNDQTMQVQGFVPIYASRQVVNTIATEAARSTVRSGKIYAYGNYLFQVEQNEGIHIIDNSNPQQAKKIAFLKVPMASEIAIKEDHLYTNNLSDILVFNLASISSPKLVHRIPDAFPVIDQTFPPFDNTAFECADSTKGVVIGWESKMITNPKCRR